MADLIRSGNYESPQQARERKYQEKLAHMLPKHDDSLIDKNARALHALRSKKKKERFRKRNIESP